MHIVFVEKNYPDFKGRGGGAGTFIRLFGMELARLGHRVSVIRGVVPDGPAHWMDGPIHVYGATRRDCVHYYAGKLPVLRNWRHRLGYLEEGRSAFRCLRFIHAEHPVDLVEYSEGGDYYSAPRSPWKRVSHLHGSRYTFNRKSGRGVDVAQWKQRTSELKFIQAADLVFSPSRAMLELVEEEMSRTIDSAIVMPLPLDPRLSQGGEDLADHENELPEIMFAARNDPVKGGATLLKAIAELNRRGREAQYRFFGYEPTEGDEVPSNVALTTFVPKEQLLDAYRVSDICVLPSHWDNSPNTVYEAMASGSAVVGSAVGGITELVVDGETGILVEPKNPIALADALEGLIRDRKRTRQFGQAGSRRILELSDLESNCSRRLAIYEALVAGDTIPSQRTYAESTEPVPATASRQKERIFSALPTASKFSRKN